MPQRSLSLSDGDENEHVGRKPETEEEASSFDEANKTDGIESLYLASCCPLDAAVIFLHELSPLQYPAHTPGVGKHIQLA